MSYPGPGPHHIPDSTPTPRHHGFVYGNSHENFPVGHPWDCSRANSLNLRVPTEPEASLHDQLPRAIWDVTIHPLRGPTSWSAHFRPRIGSDTKLSYPGPDHTLTVLFLGIHTRTSQWVTHNGIALAQTHLTSEFLRNPKSVNSQKASCGSLVTSRARSTTVARYCLLWAYHSYHSLTVLFLGTHEQLPSRSPILGVL
ncbi:hypothetical protein DVH24_000441 [Malus domestica]|uniref:Uncharacterized protein n=1 Tax=Malus domestica TaxID=3750 RepID=A0A498J4R4_MALDO|nr:hypothetical protein DVH24_000441 [Malus domestica]